VKCRFCDNEVECVIEISIIKSGVSVGKKMFYSCLSCAKKWDTNGIVECRGCGNLYVRNEGVNGKPVHTHIEVCELCDKSRIATPSFQTTTA